MTEIPSTDLLPEILPTDPMHWADAWLREAAAMQVQPHPNAMTLVTCRSNARPSSRVVLCKDFVPDPGYLVFYTNYRSRKAQEIAENPYVGVNFHWDILGRQLRIEGIAVRSPDAESDGYFASRDWGSQLGALGSDQSKTIASRAALIEQIQARAQILGLPPPHTSEAPLVTGPPPVERPQHWGGFRVWAAAIELWLAGPDRIHDRAEWRRDIVASADAQFTAGPWTGTRLQP